MVTILVTMTSVGRMEKLCEASQPISGQQGLENKLNRENSMHEADRRDFWGWRYSTAVICPGGQMTKVEGRKDRVTWAGPPFLQL